MLKETIEYEDFNGKKRTEDFYFNLNESEVLEMAAVSETDLAEKLRKVVEANDGAAIMATFKDLLARAYGEKSEDGRHFVKSKEISEAFFQTPAYNILFVRLVTQPDYTAKFIEGIIPQDMSSLKK